MDGPRDYHMEQSKSERKRQISYITYMWNLKYDRMNLSMKQKQTHRHREQTCGYQGGGGSQGGLDWKFRASRCKLLYQYIEWKNNTVRLYSTGNCVQYPVINHNGKEYEKKIVVQYTYNMKFTSRIHFYFSSLKKCVLKN